jgi:hypothetical protein
MLRIPLPEDDRFALRLSSLCVSVPLASSGGRLRSRISLAPRGATEQEIAILRNLVAPSWQSCPKGPCGAPFCVFCVFCGFKIHAVLREAPSLGSFETVGAGGATLLQVF